MTRFRDGQEEQSGTIRRTPARLAISNHRILSVEGDEVTFRWKDYAHGDKKKAMTLNASEFLRRFLMHVLPRGFVRIRFFGFLANRRRTELLHTCRRLLATEVAVPAPTTVVDPVGSADNTQQPLCPVCRCGSLLLMERLPLLIQGRSTGPIPRVDSS
jgi:hypothetical protein